MNREAILKAGYASASTCDAPKQLRLSAVASAIQENKEFLFELVKQAGDVRERLLGPVPSNPERGPETRPMPVGQIGEIETQQREIKAALVNLQAILGALADL